MDLIQQLSHNPTARKLAKEIGIPMPPELRRARGAWEARELEGRSAVIGGAGELHPALAATLAPDGASVHLAPGLDAAPYRAEAEAWSRACVLLEAEEEGPAADALLFDASGVHAPGDLRALYDFFHPRVRGLRRSGRALVLARPVASAEGAAEAATRRALEGFTRSLAKEIGRRAATAHLVTVEPGAEAHAPAVLRFLLSDRSAYISGQHLRVRALVGAAALKRVRPLEGKVALVTGAARGIGAAIAHTLSREGAHVVGLDRPEDGAPLSRVMREARGTVLCEDLLAEGATDRIVAFLTERFGALHCVVHNAGITRDKTLGRMDEARWDSVIAVNLRAVVELNTALQGGLLEDQGRVVCLSSIAGIAGNVGQTNYAASKAGIIGYVEALAAELAPRGITANAIAPGFIETRLTAEIPLFTREVGRRLCNLSQSGLPEDVAEAITFLCSPGASGLSGTILRVCGGNLLGA